MKTSSIAALCCALSCGSVGAQTAPTEYLASLVFPKLRVVEVTMPAVPLRPDPIREFIRTLTELAATPDPARLKSLYCPGPDEAAVVESMAQMQRLLADSPSLGLKEFAKLSDKSRAFWQRQVGRLTSHDSSGVLLLFRNGRVDAMIPLQISEDGVRIVPAEHRAQNE